MRLAFSSDSLRGWDRLLRGLKLMLGGALLALAWGVAADRKLTHP